MKWFIEYNKCYLKNIGMKFGFDITARVEFFYTSTKETIEFFLGRC